jgi:hypothetical protein
MAETVDTLRAIDRGAEGAGQSMGEKGIGDNGGEYAMTLVLIRTKDGNVWAIRKYEKKRSGE